MIAIKARNASAGITAALSASAGLERSSLCHCAETIELTIECNNVKNI